MSIIFAGLSAALLLGMSLLHIVFYVQDSNRKLECEILVGRDHTTDDIKKARDDLKAQFVRTIFWIRFFMVSVAITLALTILSNLTS